MGTIQSKICLFPPITPFTALPTVQSCISTSSMATIMIMGYLRKSGAASTTMYTDVVVNSLKSAVMLSVQRPGAFSSV